MVTDMLMVLISEWWDFSHFSFSFILLSIVSIFYHILFTAFESYFPYLLWGEDLIPCDHRADTLDTALGCAVERMSGTSQMI